MACRDRAAPWCPRAPGPEAGQSRQHPRTAPAQGPSPWCEKAPKPTPRFPARSRLPLTAWRRPFLKVRRARRRPEPGPAPAVAHNALGKNQLPFPRRLFSWHPPRPGDRPSSRDPSSGAPGAALAVAPLAASQGGRGYAVPPPIRAALLAGGGDGPRPPPITACLLRRRSSSLLQAGLLGGAFALNISAGTWRV